MVQTPVVFPLCRSILSVLTTHSSFTSVVYFTLKMEAVIYLETLSFDQTTRRHNPKSPCLNTDTCDISVAWFHRVQTYS
jgi:hypothetical protein